MDNLDSTASPESQEQELSHSDKMIGIFSEPSSTFEKISKFPAKTIDWFLPILLLLVFVSISQIVIRTNPDLAYQIKQKQTEAMDKRLQDEVQSGKITQEQANQQRDMAQEQMDKMSGGVGLVFQTIGILIFGFIMFFIMTGIYFLLTKFVLKGEGTYNAAMVANGLTAYIGIVGIIIATIVSMLMGKLMPDTSVASLMGMNKLTIGGWLLAKLDIFTIWAYIILSIGLAKMFKSSSTQKYYAMVFGVWIIGGLILFFLAKTVPFLKTFSM